MHTPSLDVVVFDEFVPEHVSLLERLLRDVRWDQRNAASPDLARKSRKTASYGVAYDYKEISYPAVDMHPALVPICQAVRDRLGFCPNNCLLNLYSDGLTSIGFHSDATSRLAPDTGSAIVSLGAERTLQFRCIADDTIVRSYRVQSGSLMFIPNRVQSEWTHGVPPEPGAGMRISLLFRAIAT
jgi:alkylated DNA repair dioxygenase AlkB